MHERAYPAIDCHTHLRNGIASIDCLHAEELYWKHQGNCVLSLEGNGPGFQDQNALCLAYKRKYPDSHAFGGLNHAMGEYEAQAEQLWNIGVDGFKMIEGKPDCWKRWNAPLDDACYDGFYSFCQSHGVPVLLHTADPEEFWDANRASKEALAAGWVYDETFPGKEELTGQTIRVLEKFPKLKLIMAHFFFLADDLPRLGTLLDDHPGLHVDITPGAPPYEHFARDIVATRDFFTRYKGRILYGTDSIDMYTPEDRAYMDSVVDIVARFLDTEDDMELWGLKLKGIRVPGDVQQSVLSGNFLRLAPYRPLHSQKAESFFHAMLTDQKLSLNETERKTIDELWV